MDFNLLGLNQYQIDSASGQASLFKYKQDLKSRANAMLGHLTVEIDKVPEFKGAGVCYIDRDDHVYKLREFESIARAKPVYIVLRQPPDSLKINDFEAYIRQNNVSPRETKLATELKGLGYNCSGMALGWIGAATTGVGSLVTFGFSSVVFVISISAAVAGTVQCVNSGFRVYDQAFSDGKINEKLDTEEWYANTMKALEAVSLLSAAVGVKGILKILKTDILTYGPAYVRNKLKELTLKSKKELTVQLANINNSMLDNLYFLNLSKGPFSNIVRTRTIYNKAVTSHLIDAIGSAIAVKGSIDTGGILNPSKPNEFSIGILQGLEDA